MSRSAAGSPTLSALAHPLRRSPLAHVAGAVMLLALGAVTLHAQQQKAPGKPKLDSTTLSAQLCPMSVGQPLTSGGTVSAQIVGCGAIPSVTPDGASATVSPGANSYVFTVRNVGATGTLYFSQACSGPAVLSCSVSPTSASLAAGASRTVTVYYTGASGGGTGTVDLYAEDINGVQRDDGWVYVTVNAPPTYTVSVTPDGGSVAVEPGSSSYNFTVVNTGNQTTTYYLTPSCSGVVTGCSAPGSVTLGPGGSTAVGVSYSATTRGASGTLALTAAYSGNGAIQDGGSVTVSVNNSYGVSVTPDAGSKQIFPGTSTVYIDFVVTNTGSSTITYSLTAMCGRFDTTYCSAPASVTVGAGSSAGVTVTADASALGTSFSATLDANDFGHGTQDRGSVNVTTATFTVAVGPKGALTNTEAHVSSSYGFSVYNSGTATATYTLSASCNTGGVGTGTAVSNCASPSSVTVSPGTSQNVTVTFTTGNPRDSGVVSLTAYTTGTSDQGTLSVVIYDHSVAVSPDGTNVPVEPGTYNQSFTVQNFGTIYTTYTLTPSCTSVATGCSASAGSVSLLPGASSTVNVSYSAQTRGGTGTVRLTAAYGSISDAGYVNVSVNNTYTVSVTPDNGSYSTDANTSGSFPFFVQSTGTGGGTYNLAVSCSNGPTNCSVSPTSVTLAAGAQAMPFVSFTNGLIGSAGRISLIATLAGNVSVKDSGWVTTSARTYTVAVSPHGGSAVTETGTASQSFSVLNSGNSVASYALSTVCSGSATGCSAPASVSVNPGTSGPVTVSYIAGAPGTTGGVKLFASAGTNASVTRDSGWVNATVASHTVAVTPDNQAVAVDAGAAVQSFNVQNTGNVQNSYNITYLCSNAAAGCSASAASVTLGAGASQAVNVSYTGAATGGSGSIKLFAAYASNLTIKDSGSVNVSVRVYAVSVTPDGFADRRDPGVVGAPATFTITNGGNQTDTYNLVATCTGAVTGCVTAAATNAVAPGGAFPVTVTYNTAAAGTGTITLRATSQARSTVTDVGSVNLTINSYTVAVTPKSGTVNVEAGAAGSQSFTVKNVGNATTTYTLAASCSGAGASGCSAPGSASVAAGDSARITLSYTAGAAGASGAVKLVARYGSGATAAADSGSVGISVSSYVVAVTPDGQAVSVDIGANSQVFTVRNAGNRTSLYTLSVLCSGQVTGCAPSDTLIQLAAGASGSPTVSYSLPSPGASGVVQLIAKYSGNLAINDAGSITATAFIVAGAQVRLVDPKARAVIERDLCLTASAGKGAAYECGDLRIAHPLPTTHTYNRTHTPGLLYNSQHAHPYAVVAADVTIPASATSPVSVVGTLKRVGNGAVDATATWDGGAWPPGSTRRVALAFDASALTTGIYPYTLTITTVYGSHRTDSTATGNLVIVNRKNSPFGQGWWLAGLEWLYPAANGAFLWVGGDGSTRRYDPVAGVPNVWGAESVDRPDTLKKVGDSVYVRYLAHGIQVQYDRVGRHLATIDRLGHATRFDYLGLEGVVTDTLRAIHLAVPAGGADRSYTFGYVGGWLRTVQAPAVNGQPRTTTVANDTVHGVVSVQDPDLHLVRFGYATGQLDSRTDRLGNRTTFAFDNGHRLSRVSVEMGSAPSLTTTYCATEAYNLAACRPSPTQPESVYTVINGPRKDTTVTRFWVDRFGAPTRIRNALGYQTLMDRANLGYPALVTRVVKPNGQILAAVYDARANMIESTDSSTWRDEPSGRRYATTRYEWESNWGLATKIVPPERDSTVMAYDPATGNRLWQQDARGDSTRVSYQYYPATGLLHTVTLPRTPPSELLYDAQGNLQVSATPLGFRTTYLADAAGRDTLIVSPIDSVNRQYHRMQYDLMDRVVVSVDSASPVRGLVAMKAVIVNSYDDEGQLRRVARVSSPDRAHVDTLRSWFSYDPAGRAVKRSQSDTLNPTRDDPLTTDSTVFDAAGNAVEQISRRGHHILMSYDALNRLATRAIPGVSYPAQILGNVSYPLSQTGGLTIQPDLQTFSYDSAGNIRTANNNDAQISRYYNRNGALASDTLRIRTYAGNDFTKHVYGLNYRYDLDRRRIVLLHPRNMAPVFRNSIIGTDVKDSVRYVYDGAGYLQSVTDPLGNVYTYRHDALGQLDSLHLSDAYYRRWYYDADGRDTLRVDRGLHFQGSRPQGGTTDTIQSAHFTLDGRGKLLHVQSFADSVNLGYDGLGQLVDQMRQGIPINNPRQLDNWMHEQMDYDALGNKLSITTETATMLSANSFQYSPALGRLVQRLESPNYQPGAGGDTTGYDRQGNVATLQRVVYTKDVEGHTYPILQKTINYYGADQRLRISDMRSDAYIVVGGVTLSLFRISVPTSVVAAPTEFFGAYEEYRYDALGRRIMARMRKDSSTMQWGTTTPVRILDGSMDRFIWDGDQLLYETHYGQARLEDDTTTVYEYSACGFGPNHHCGADPSHSDTLYFAGAGRVLYTHGVGIDAPLSVIRVGYGQDSVLFDPFALIPLDNWRGSDERGFTPWGAQRTHQLILWCDTCSTNGVAWLDFSTIDWPAPFESASHQHPVQANKALWIGGLIGNQRTQGGQVYMRNRYYDPDKGQFTQEDPIGLAGGLNLYGFAGGDPVNYGDPFGLCCFPPRALDNIIYMGLFTGRISTDQRNERKITTLDPSVQPAARQFMNLAAMSGHPMRITEGYRTLETQAAYYAQGRTAPGPKITNAPAGLSPHNYQLAMDAYPVVNGKINFDATRADYEQVLGIATATGWEWGGNWVSFKDMPHYQMLGGKTVQQLNAERLEREKKKKEEEDKQRQQQP